jgi:hypothetical protein
MFQRTHVFWMALIVFAAGMVAGWALKPGIRQPSAQEGWLTGSSEEKLAAVERHLRGLDQVMVEVGYRFTELYWAGKDRNWVYARYQLDKIETALNLGVERRPKRAASAAPFLADEIPAMRRAVELEEEAAFQEGIARFRSACMKCHVQESVPWFVVEMPEHRLSPIRSAR